MAATGVKKVVLAYSGGLDTSVIVPWLKNNYDCEVVCFLCGSRARRGTGWAGSKGDRVWRFQVIYS